MSNPYHISKEIQFDAGHRVPNHASKCRNPHGHRYRVVAHLKGDVIMTPGDSSEGMLMDFSDVKRILEEVHDHFDHGFIVYTGDRTLINMFCSEQAAMDWKVIEFDYVPTAENLARWIYDYVEPEVLEHFNDNLVLDRIELWETPTSMASYRGN